MSSKMELLPLEMRILVYEALDHPSRLQMRVVNSWFRDDVDGSVGLSLSIETSKVATQGEEVSQLFLKKIQSVKFFGTLNDPEPKPAQVIHGWKGKAFVFMYPSFVKTLEFGSFTLDVKTNLTLTGFYHTLKDCHNLEKLVISQIKFHGRFLRQKQKLILENVIKSFRKLQTIKLKWLEESYDNESPELTVRTTSLMASILKNIQSSSLKAFELSLKGTTYGLDLNDIMSFPWIKALKLVARHWRTIKVLDVQIIPTCYFPHWLNQLEKEVRSSTNESSWKEFMDDLNNVRNLNVLRFFNLSNNNFTWQHDIETNLCFDLVVQQQSLEELHLYLHKAFKFDMLSQVIQQNRATLKNFSLACFLRSSNVVNENFLDMDIFYTCQNLESIYIDFTRDFQRTRDFRIVNLRFIPIQLKSLTLYGLYFPDDSEPLLDLSSSENEVIKSIRLGFYPCESIADLIVIVTNFVRNFSGLESLDLKVLKPNAHYGENEDIWELDYTRLVTLFGLFTTHEILVKHGNRSSWPYDNMDYYSLTVNTITSEDRVRIQEYVQANGMQ